jgi:hypothetical protein
VPALALQLLHAAAALVTLRACDKPARRIPLIRCKWPEKSSSVNKGSSAARKRCEPCN